MVEEYTSALHQFYYLGSNFRQLAYAHNTTNKKQIRTHIQLEIGSDYLASGGDWRARTADLMRVKHAL